MPEIATSRYRDEWGGGGSFGPASSHYCSWCGDDRAVEYIVDKLEGDDAKPVPVCEDCLADAMDQFDFEKVGDSV